MEGIELLRQQALLRRNAAIRAARREYHTALKEINALARKLRANKSHKVAKVLPSDYSGLKPTTVALEILREGKPMTLAELTIEVQRRGCRSADDPRPVAHAIDNGL